MTLFKVTEIVFYLLLLLIPYEVFAENPPDISGVYRCIGEDFLNHRTFDEPTTVKKTGATYFFTWMNKEVPFYGTAIVNQNTVSSIFWAPTIESALPGVVTYQILPNGDLKGKWTVKKGEVTGNEYCQKIK